MPASGLMGATNPIRTEGQRRACIQQGLEGICCLRTLMSDTLFRPASVIDAMVGLHRGNHMQLRKARYIFRPQMLRMLDTQPAVAGTILLLEPLVHIEDCFIRAISDSVGGDVKAGAIGSLQIGVELIRMRESPRSAVPSFQEHPQKI